jgi:predicted acyl esterase
MASSLTGCQIPRVRTPVPLSAARRALLLASSGRSSASVPCAGPPVDPNDRPATHQYTVEYDSVKMRDGIWLGITRWVPVAMKANERFPVLLEMIPYRKDDDFYARDFPLYDWFARRGFLMAKVDVRGTGASTGPVPSREYSEAELDDAVELIASLAADPRANGRVGMWGISWGGFNAIQIAMRQPPALRAILAMHASDDLFHDDVRYIDGVLHLDRYALQIDHGNGLPRTPRYGPRLRLLRRPASRRAPGCSRTSPSRRMASSGVATDCDGIAPRCRCRPTSSAGCSTATATRRSAHSRRRSPRR